MRITIETEHNGGQLRSYGPHTWIGTVFVETTCLNDDGTLGHESWDHADEKIIGQWLRGVVPWYEPLDPPSSSIDEWSKPRLKSLTQIEPGLWRYLVEANFID